MKLKQVLDAFNILNTTQYSKLDDLDKIKLWKITRVLKPFAIKLQEDIKETSEKFMQEFDNFKENLQKAQAYETGDSSVMTKEEYESFIKDFIAYKVITDKAIESLTDVEQEILIDKLSEEAFGKLISSNNWTFEVISKIDFIME